MKTYILVLTLLGVLFSPLFAINDMSVIAEFQGEHHRSGYGFTIESLDFNHDDVGLHYVLRQVPSTMMFTIMWGG